MRAVAAMLVCLLATTAAAEDGPDVRRLAFAEKGTDLVISGSVTDVFDRDLLEQLSSGFAQTVAIQAYVYRTGVDAPVWYAAATYRAVYAVWDEVYLVRL